MSQREDYSCEPRDLCVLRWWRPGFFSVHRKRPRRTRRRNPRRLLETRVRRLASPRIYSQEPRSRTSRIIANVSIEESSTHACTVRSKFVMIEYRRESQRLFAGTAFHHLVQADGGIRIASKRVDLVNCDAPLDGIVVPF